jgi:flagellar motility protein MotE (MotC chaperone)
MVVKEALLKILLRLMTKEISLILTNLDTAFATGLALET